MESVRIGSKMVVNIVGEAGKRKWVAQINLKSGSAVKQCSHIGDAIKDFSRYIMCFPGNIRADFPKRKNATRKAFYYWPFPKKNIARLPLINFCGKVASATIKV